MISNLTGGSGSSVPPFLLTETNEMMDDGMIEGRMEELSRILGLGFRRE